MNAREYGVRLMVHAHEMGLSHVTSAVLLVLADGRKRTRSEITRIMGWSGGWAISSTVTKMLRYGWAEELDDIGVWIRITEEGRKKAYEMMK